MEFLMGFLGALLAVGLFVAGTCIGWTLKGQHFAQTQKVTAEALTEAQKQRVREEQEAWMALHNYSVDDAYGVRPPSEPITEKE